jgi:hypothetical protein
MLPSIAPRAVAPLLLRSSLASSIPLTWSPSTVAARRHSSTLLATRSQRPAQISAGWMGARPAMASAAQPSAVIIFRRLATTGSDGQQQQQQQKTEDGGAGAGSAGAGAGAGASAGAGAGAGKQGFFSSDSWTKTVGTIGALANWAIPLAVSTQDTEGEMARLVQLARIRQERARGLRGSSCLQLA